MLSVVHSWFAANFEQIGPQKCGMLRRDTWPISSLEPYEWVVGRGPIRGTGWARLHVAGWQWLSDSWGWVELCSPSRSHRECQKGSEHGSPLPDSQGEWVEQGSPSHRTRDKLQVEHCSLSPSSSRRITWDVSQVDQHSLLTSPSRREERMDDRSPSPGKNTCGDQLVHVPIPPDHSQQHYPGVQSLLDYDEEGLLDDAIGYNQFPKGFSGSSPEPDTDELLVSPLRSAAPPSHNVHSQDETTVRFRDHREKAGPRTLPPSEDKSRSRSGHQGEAMSPDVQSCRVLLNSLGPPVTIWRGSARPDFPGVTIWRGSARPDFPGVSIWRPPLAAHVASAATWRQKHRSYIMRRNLKYHTLLLTSQKLVLFPFYHPIKMKLTSVVGWNWKHWPDLTRPILHKLI